MQSPVLAAPPSASVPCSICPPLHEAMDELMLSSRFLHSKKPACVDGAQLRLHLLWTSTDAERRGAAAARLVPVRREMV